MLIYVGWIMIDYRFEKFEIVAIKSFFFFPKSISSQKKTELYSCQSNIEEMKII